MTRGNGTTKASRVARSLLILVVVLVPLGLGAVWLKGGDLVAPVNHSVGLPPADLDIEMVNSGDVQGWFITSPGSRKCVLLLHGIRSDRRSMMPRARFLAGAGYSSLAIDLQAHGENPGASITFGYREAVDVQSSVNYLRDHRNCRRLAVIGKSLGGAAALLGQAPLQVDALILESVYPTIEEAVRNRLAIRLGFLGEFVAPLFYWQIPLRMDISLNKLRPIEGMKRVRAPVLVITGSRDRHTTATESKRLFDEVSAAKDLWIVTGAGHEDYYQFNPVGYEKVVLRFLDASMTSYSKRG